MAGIVELLLGLKTDTMSSIWSEQAVLMIQLGLMMASKKYHVGD